jgi:N-formylglutamate amidohydrolase
MNPQQKGVGESAMRDAAGVPCANAPGSIEQPFTVSMGEKPPIPVLLSVPHAGRAYPTELSARMRQPKLACLRLEDRFVDLLGQEVARETGAGLLVAHAPRAMIDLNRTPDDMDWDMVIGGAPHHTGRLAAGSRARSGLGLVPRRLPGMGELWQRRMTLDELEARLAQVHGPYHTALADGLEQLRDRWGAALLIDLHSMPPLGRKTGPDAAPDFVVGDRFGASCASHLSAAALQHFAEAGRAVAHNRPYAGGYVLDRHGAPARGIHAMQIEVCRTAYLDASLSEPGPGLAAVARVLAALIRRLAADLAIGRGMAQAAE